MTPEMNPMDPVLEQAVSEIRDESVDSEMVEAAARRVWARLAEASGHPAAEHIRGCADFQALIPEYRAGSLTEARALLLKDHLHQCVACRRIYEGKVVAFPGWRPGMAAPRRPRYAVRWAAAAAVVAAAGVSTWFVVDHYGSGPGKAVVQAVNGALYEVSPAGVQPLAAGRVLTAGMEIRTAKDSDATLQLWDGSTVELRERTELSASEGGKDVTIRVDRGSIFVQAAKRRAGHLYVATADCRVAVTGTVFGVTAGTKGSRISVIQGEVRVDENSQERVLHPGDQSVIGPSLEQTPVQYDLSWSRNGERLSAGQSKSSSRVSPLLQRAPASTVLFAFVPKVAGTLGDAQASLRQTAAQNPQLRAWLASKAVNLDSVLSHLQAASEYVDEVAMLAFQGANNQPEGPVFLATVKRQGLGDLLNKSGLPFTVIERPGLAIFGSQREAVEALARLVDAPQGGFESSPCYARLSESQQEGAGAALCADLARFGQPVQGARYFMAEEKPVNGQIETHATVGFDGPRTGLAAWLAPPAPMGALDYISADATLVAAFVVNKPGAILDETLALQQQSKAAAEKTLANARQQTGIDIRSEIAASLGGEFALALDGPILPTPSLKLIVEVYDQARFQATLQKVVDGINRESAKTGGKPLRTSQEVVDGRTYYAIGAAVPNPLTEAQYTFADGYLIAAWGSSRGLLTQALQVKAARTSIGRSLKFTSMMPRDHYANFSALIYQNLGSTLAPVAGLLSAFAPPRMAGRGMPDLNNIKPTFVAAYGEPDRITVAGTGAMLGMSVGDLTNASLLSIAGNSLPIGQLMGTRGRAPAFR